MADVNERAIRFADTDGNAETTAEPMQLALREAEAAYAVGDVPVGAVIVRNGCVVVATHNTREVAHTALGHAEIHAIGEACRILDSKWLADCTLYVTLEPCPMCAGAILQARIPRVICGAKDPVAGAMGSVWALHRHPIDAGIEVSYGDHEEEAVALLKAFFKNARGGRGDSQA